MTDSPMEVIARVRRAMPRNVDVMAICDAAEKALVAPKTIIVCPECSKREQQNKERQRRFREKRK